VWELDVRATLPAFFRLLPVVAAGAAGEVIILKIAMLLFRLAELSVSFPLTGAANDLDAFAISANTTRKTIFAKFFILKIQFAFQK